MVFVSRPKFCGLGLGIGLGLVTAGLDYNTADKHTVKGKKIMALRGWRLDTATVEYLTEDRTVVRGGGLSRALDTAVTLLRSSAR